MGLAGFLGSGMYWIKKVQHSIVQLINFNKFVGKNLGDIFESQNHLEHYGDSGKVFSCVPGLRNPSLPFPRLISNKFESS